MSGTADNSYLLQLIEELCTNHDKVCEETNKEKEDLQQQVKIMIKIYRTFGGKKKKKLHCMDKIYDSTRLKINLVDAFLECLHYLFR